MLDNAASFAGSIAVPLHGGTIDLVGLAASNPIITGNVLKVDLSGGGTLAFTLIGDSSGLGAAATSDGASGTDLTIHTAPPSKPDLAAASDSGASSTDNNTRITTPVFAGTAGAEESVTLYDGVTVIGTGKANGLGSWSIKSSTLASGVHAVKARATDLAGNVSVFSSALHVAIDTAAPAAPSKPDLTAGSDSGASNTDNISKVTTPLLTGTAEAGATVTLGDGRPLRSARARRMRQGAWSIKSTTLAGGVRMRSRRGATDLAGNVSVFSSALRVAIDTAAPAAPSKPDLTAGSDSGGVEHRQHLKGHDTAAHWHGRSRCDGDPL